MNNATPGTPAVMLNLCLFSSEREPGGGGGEPGAVSVMAISCGARAPSLGCDGMVCSR